jgi:hypothetical protein
MSESRSGPSKLAPQNYGEHKEVLRSYILAQTRILDFTIHSLSTGEGIEDKDALEARRDVVSTILLMIQAMGISCHSIHKLTAEFDMSIRDCLSIARSIAETAVNVSYIIAGGTKTATSARRHALSKSYRDMERSGSLGSFKFRVEISGSKPDPSTIDGMKEALAEFTNANGREIRDWTPDNLDRRIDLIRQTFGDVALNFAGSNIAIYRHASEIIHGTYFGVVFFWTGGLGKAATNRREFEYLYLTNHFLMVFMAVFFGVMGVIEIISAAFKIPTLLSASNELLAEFRAYHDSYFVKVERPDRPA